MVLDIPASLQGCYRTFASHTQATHVQMAQHPVDFVWSVGKNGLKVVYTLYSNFVSWLDEYALWHTYPCTH